MKFIVYTKEDCPYCVKLKDFMKNNNIQYEERVYLKDFNKTDFENLFKETEKTYPRVLDESENCIGGYQDFLKYYKIHLSWS